MNWNIIIDIMIAAAFVLLSAHLVPWLQAQLKARGREDLAKLIGDLVAAAEQIFAGPKRGDEKRGYVNEELVAMGHDITGEVDAMIEAAVFRLNKKDEQ